MLNKFRTVVTLAFALTTFVGVGCDLDIDIPENEEEGDDMDDGEEGEDTGDDVDDGDDHDCEPPPEGCEEEVFECYDQAWEICEGGMPIPLPEPVDPEPPVDPEQPVDPDQPDEPGDPMGGDEPGQWPGDDGQWPGDEPGDDGQWPGDEPPPPPPGGDECEQALQQCAELEEVCWGEPPPPDDCDQHYDVCIQDAEQALAETGDEQLYQELLFGCEELLQWCFEPPEPPPFDPCEDVVIACHDEAFAICEQDPEACDDALQQCNIVAEECWGDLDPDPEVPDPCFLEVDVCFDHVMEACEAGDDLACEQGVLECEAMAQECGGGGEVPPCFDEVDACFLAADQACFDAMDPQSCDAAYHECEQLLEVCAC